MRSTAIVIILSCIAVAQTANKNPAPRSDQQKQSPVGESSSKDSKIDLSAPKGDDIKHAGDEEDTSDVMETKPWNPHKAAKDIEVGDYYAKRKNYRAAISRYREALEYKPKDATATFRLAQALETVGEKEEALQRYQEYLKILPGGECAAEAKAGVERLKKGSS
jgi:tetratricopeptide (TPR) repeat protein